ncbi:hypothetical protein FOZ60_017342 [Perkinsus olseni]|uniref:Uncharacterized protein n=1 Tax=Perkinsus olseni TaxID=32597 RepID=A0A7J6P559_PEROL|nr:hypothetical protein FOZ60_017342 [Perkinsus olseni]
MKVNLYGPSIRDESGFHACRQQQESILVPRRLFSPRPQQTSHHRSEGENDIQRSKENLLQERATRASAAEGELQRRVEALGEEVSILRQQLAEKERTLREISSYYDKELNAQAEQRRAELGRFDLVVEIAKRDAIKDTERDAQIGSEKLRMNLNDLQNRLQLQTIELLRRTHEHEYSVRLHREEVGSLRRLLAHTATRQREQFESLKESMKLEQKSEMKRYKEGFLRKATTELRGGLDQADVKIKEYSSEMERLQQKLRVSETDKYKARAELRKAKEMRTAAMNTARDARRELATVHEKNEELFKCCQVLYRQLGGSKALPALPDVGSAPVPALEWLSHAERTYALADAAVGQENTTRSDRESARKTARGSEASTRCPPTSREGLLQSQLKRATQKLEEMKRTAIIISKIEVEDLLPRSCQLRRLTIIRSTIEQYLHEALANCRSEKAAAAGSAAAAVRRIKARTMGEIPKGEGGGESEHATNGDSNGLPLEDASAPQTVGAAHRETFLTGAVDNDYTEDENEAPVVQSNGPARAVPPLLLDGVDRGPTCGMDELAAALERAQLGEEVDLDVGQLSWESKEHILRMIFRRINSDPMAAINNRERARLRAQLASLGTAVV